MVAVVRGIEWSKPPGVRYRWTPAQPANRGLCVRNPEKFTDARGSNKPADRTAEGEDHWFALLRVHRRWHGAKNEGEKNGTKRDQFLLVTRVHGSSLGGDICIVFLRGLPPKYPIHLPFGAGQQWNCEGLYHLFVYVNIPISFLAGQKMERRRQPSPRGIARGFDRIAVISKQIT
jgi:hypothetical protein